jgi:hypothetical protein
MGWQDRDYAKWTDHERRRYYGFGSVSPRRGLLRPGAGLAVLASLAIALGQLPLHHPLVPALHFGGAIAPRASSVGTISGVSTATVGSHLTLHGSAPAGAVTVQGSYDGGRTWTTLSSVQSIGGTYTATVQLAQRGDLSLKVIYANGSTATGSVVVQ